MRLRLGRGLPRHNLQSWLDFEDFLYNRTDGTPQDIFKTLGDAATKYVQTVDLNTIRNSSIPEKLGPDALQPIPGLFSNDIKTLCSLNVYKKAKRFEVKNSEILSTQVHLLHNTITGCYKAVKIYDQMIQWGGDCTLQIPFSVSSIQFSCTCPFFTKSEATPVKCCKHIAGHLRRIIYISSM